MTWVCSVGARGLNRRRDGICGLVGLGLGLWGMGLSSGMVLAVEPLLPAEWLQDGHSLVTVCQFTDFAATVEFVGQLVEPADRLGHHPDLAIAYNRLTIRLTTHDAGGITGLDMALAREISALQDDQCQLPAEGPNL
ncbi:MAG: 4a-hydroxytetrahydrobiopterin dehydratase [Cyanobacteria bacterium J06638_6]